MEQFNKLDKVAISAISEFETNWKGNISNSTKFEVYMLGMMIGFHNSLEKGYIMRNSESVDLLIETIVKQSDKQLGLSRFKIEPLIKSRLTGLRKDLIGLSRSDYPSTKQYMPEYTFNCIVYQPLMIEQDLSWANFGDGGDFDDDEDFEKIELSMDFLEVYYNHVNFINAALGF